MKKVLLVLMMLFVSLLAGCSSEAEFETVSDTVLPVSNLREAFSISVTLPDDVVEQTFLEEGELHFFQQADGAYDVLTQVMQGVNAEAALRELTGQDTATLTVLKTDRHGLPEYRTTWYTMSSEGGSVHRASVIYDGFTSYCVSFSMPEDASEALHDQMVSIMDSITLDPKES